MSQLNGAIREEAGHMRLASSVINKTNMKLNVTPHGGGFYLS